MRLSTTSSFTTAAAVLSFLLCWRSSVVHSWTTAPVTRKARQSSPLSAGFGNSDSKKEASAPPLKPKQQWDRYLALKQAPRVMVGVQIQGTNDWLSVGSVKANDVNALEAAVLRQRALIADHAKRLFPLQVTAKTKLNWGMKMLATGGGDDESEISWKALDPKAVTMSTEILLDKDIGFEGQPDSASGYYCVYDQGKVLNSSSSSGSDQKSSSFKKKSV